MKTQNILVLILLVFGTIACEKEEFTTVATPENGIVLNINSERSPEIDTLQKRIYWASYISGAVLFKQSNSNILAYFNSKLSTGQRTFSLDLYLGNNPPDGGNFKNQFKNILGQAMCGYSNNTEGCPDLGNQSPPPPPWDPPGGIIQQGIPSQVDMYISYLINDNCIELFIPNGLVGLNPFEQNRHVATLAHPFNNASAAYGIKRTGDHDTQLQYITNNYVNFVGSVIVARPNRNTGISSGIRNEENEACDYAQFEIDFEDFLD